MHSVFFSELHGCQCALPMTSYELLEVNIHANLMEFKNNIIEYIALIEETIQWGGKEYISPISDLLRRFLEVCK